MIISQSEGSPSCRCPFLLTTLFFRVVSVSLDLTQPRLIALATLARRPFLLGAALTLATAPALSGGGDGAGGGGGGEGGGEGGGGFGGFGSGVMGARLLFSSSCATRRLVTT